MSGFVYHTTTKNLSFIQTARDLNLLGIKNNMFFLKLYNPKLLHVDPYSPILTQDMVFDIINECIINPWYFLREIARIPEQGGEGIPYQLNRANLASTWCFLNGIDNYLVIPRQIGKTQSTLSILDWAFLFGTTNSEFMFININQGRANANLNSLKEQRDILPAALQFKLKHTVEQEGVSKKAKENVTTLENINNGNKIITKPSASSLEKAENIGRGCTQPIQYYDEVEFTDYIKDIVEAAGPAFNTASDNAKANNAAYCRIFTSTPGDLDTRPCKQALEMINKTTKWSEEFYDWDIDDVKTYIEENSENRIVYIEYQYKQLGKDEKWFKKICGIINNNPAKIKREIFLQRMRGSAESPFEQEDLEALLEMKGKVKEEIFINKLFKLDLYDKLDPKIPYLVGVDVATGSGADNTAITIVNPYTLKVVGEFSNNMIGVNALQKLLFVLIRKYIPKGILCIERNHNGEAVMDNLRNTPIKMNIYFDNSKDLLGSKIDDKVDGSGFLQLEARRRRYYGVYTERKSREIMMNLLFTHVQEKKETIVGSNIIDDIMGLVRNSRGKIEASIGNHDDSVMSWLIALYIYYYGNNLQRYGFCKGDIPSAEASNVGLSYDDCIREMDESIQKQFVNTSYKSIDDYTANIRAEIENARRNSSGYGSSGLFASYSQNIDSEYDDCDEEIFMGDDFFSTLNS